MHHIVSNVCGELLPQLTPIDVLRAVFPGGTITGCPKFRCMQIIAELEARGAPGLYRRAWLHQPRWLDGFQYPDPQPDAA